MARIRAADPEAARRYQREFHASNRERQTKKMRDYYGRRFFWAKMTKLRGANRATHVELARLWKIQKGLCALTGRRLTRNDAELDHKVARTRGGSDSIENLQWTCRVANRAKRELSDDEFASLCGDVMRWIGDRIALVESEIKA